MNNFSLLICPVRKSWKIHDRLSLIHRLSFCTQALIFLLFGPEFVGDLRLLLFVSHSLRESIGANSGCVLSTLALSLSRWPCSGMWHGWEQRTSVTNMPYDELKSPPSFFLNQIYGDIREVLEATRLLLDRPVSRSPGSDKGG